MSKNHGMGALLAVALLLGLGACGGGGPDEMSRESSRAGAAAESGAGATAEAQDYSGAWWYRTFGDETVLAESSELAIFRKQEDLGRDEALSARFRSQGGKATLWVELESADGDREEEMALTSEQYLELWRQVVETGFVAAAMAGEQGFGSGTAIYLHGSAGPQELGWSVSSTRAGLNGVEASRKLVELLETTAAEHSALYREES
ncbi:MAG: hypothetical protein SX243_16605 [Acidobacteriota bacterium]|nr:hypothetical protein [Acidobacteriota bacterium]